MTDGKGRLDRESTSMVLSGQGSDVLDEDFADSTKYAVGNLR
jgi:hypothetical protein